MENVTGGIPNLMLLQLIMELFPYLEASSMWAGQEMLSGFGCLSFDHRICFESGGDPAEVAICG